jgi:hypothetical protein
MFRERERADQSVVRSLKMAYAVIGGSDILFETDCGVSAPRGPRKIDTSFDGLSPSPTTTCQPYHQDQNICRGIADSTFAAGSAHC